MVSLKVSQHLGVPPELDEFAKQVGLFIEYWGFKRVQGEIWAHLYVSAEPLDRSELMRRTGISKGLASVYLKEMLEYQVIQASGKKSRGTVLYQANPDQETVIRNVLRKRERKMLAQVRTALTLCRAVSQEEKENFSLSDDRMDACLKMVGQAEGLLDFFLSHDSHLFRLAAQIVQQNSKADLKPA